MLGPFEATKFLGEGWTWAVQVWLSTNGIVGWALLPDVRGRASAHPTCAFESHDPLDTFLNFNQPFGSLGVRV